MAVGEPADRGREPAPLDASAIPNLVPWYTGWAAALSAGAAALGAAAFGAFIAAGEPFATLANAMGVLLGLAVLPVARGTDLVFRPRYPWRSPVFLGLGLLGGVAIALSSLGLLLGMSLEGPVDLEVAGTVGSGILGIWLLGVNIMSLPGRVFGWRLVGLGLMAGVGYVVLTMGGLLYGSQNPLAAGGGLVAVVAYTIWATWLGRLFLA